MVFYIILLLRANGRVGLAQEEKAIGEELRDIEARVLDVLCMSNLDDSSPRDLAFSYDNANATGDIEQYLTNFNFICDISLHLDFYINFISFGKMYLPFNTFNKSLQ